MGRDSSVGIATGYGLDCPGIESQWKRDFSVSVQTGPGAHPASCTISTGSFLGVKRSGRGVDHPSPFTAEVKERVELSLYSMDCSRINFTFYLTFTTEHFRTVDKPQIDHMICPEIMLVIALCTIGANQVMGDRI
jgi:hypothetical protein